MHARDLLEAELELEVALVDSCFEFIMILTSASMYPAELIY